MPKPKPRAKTVAVEKPFPEWVCVECGKPTTPGDGLCRACLADWDLAYNAVPWEQLDRDHRAGKIMDGYQLARIRAGRLQAIKPLGKRATEAMTALRELKAIDSEHRVTAMEIARKAAGPKADADDFKRALSQLKTRNLVDSTLGRDGGWWLTDAGQQRPTA